MSEIVQSRLVLVVSTVSLSCFHVSDYNPPELFRTNAVGMDIMCDKSADGRQHNDGKFPIGFGIMFVPFFKLKTLLEIKQWNIYCQLPLTNHS